VVSNEHPLFTSWLDLEGEKCMFNEYQLDNWEQDHLWACHWYLEMPIDKTPRHEEGNRRSVEPSFKAPNPVPQPAIKASNASNGGGRKAKGKGKGTAAAAQGVTREVASRAKKRGLAPDASESTKRSKLLEDHSAQNDPLDAPPCQSLNVSSRVVSQSTTRFGGNDWGLRNELVHRDVEGQEYFDTILNISVPALMDNKDASEKFSRFVTKVGCNEIPYCFGVATLEVCLSPHVIWILQAHSCTLGTLFLMIDFHA
jgi:hypothetical protein